MARLPQPGGDSGNWGQILNDYLLQAHNEGGALKNGSVTAAILANGAVQTSHITDGVVTENKLAQAVRDKLNAGGGGGDPTLGGDLSGTASNAQLVAGVVGATELTNSAVTTAKVADGAVTEAKLDSALATKINNAAAGSIADGSVSAAKLNAGAGSDGQVLVLDSTAAGGFKWQTVTSGSAAPTGPAGGSLAGTYPNPTLAASAVTTAALANGSVTLAKIASTGATNGQVLTFDGTNLTWATPQTGSTSAVTSVAGKTGDVTLVQTDIANLTSDLAEKATDTAVVHLAGAETVTGVKTFSASPIVPTPTTDTQAANKSYVDSVVASGAVDATATQKGVVQLAGDLGGSATSPAVTKVRGVTVSSTAPTANQVLTYDSASSTAVWRDPATSSAKPNILTGVSSGYNAKDGDFIIANASAGEFFVNLPAPTAGAQVSVKKIDSSSNAVTIRGGAAAIDGYAGTIGYSLPEQWTSQDLLADGNQWYLI